MKKFKILLLVMVVIFVGILIHNHSSKTTAKECFHLGSDFRAKACLTQLRVRCLRESGEKKGEAKEKDKYFQKCMNY